MLPASATSRVLLTDGGTADVLDLASENVELSRGCYHPGAEVSVARYRWGGLCESAGDADEHRRLPAALRGPWDYVLAADVTYSQKTHAALCTTLRCLLEQAVPPRCLLSHQHRLGDPPLEAFSDSAAAHGLAVEVLSRVERVPEGGDQPCRASILELSLS